MIFPGGSDSEVFHTYINNVQNEMKILSGLVTEFNPAAPKITEVVQQMESTMKKLREAFAFVSCLSAQNVKDEKAKLLVGKRSELKAEMSAIQTQFEQKLVSIQEVEWQELLNRSDMKELAFVLNENREQAKDLLSVEQEVLINDLAVDGYHAWSQMYDTIVGNMSVEIEEDGEVKSYSVGQASNKISDPDRAVRKHVFE